MHKANKTKKLTAAFTVDTKMLMSYKTHAKRKAGITNKPCTPFSITILLHDSYNTSQPHLYTCQPSLTLFKITNYLIILSASMICSLLCVLFGAYNYPGTHIAKKHLVHHIFCIKPRITSYE